MDGATGESITQLINDAQAGRDVLPDELITAAYEELTSIGRRMLRQERHRQTLQTRGLIHEAYLRFHGLGRIEWRDRGHFFSVWAGIMRRVLIDYARASQAAKRGGDGLRITLSDDMPDRDNDLDVLELSSSLDRLAQWDAIQAHIVELRYFGGLTIDETARALTLSAATVKRKWALAQAWLFRDLSAVET